ncbi:MAG: hypothetical protein JAY97_16030 [Candidatus Thiodiazotropha sp. 'RUGA']|nr:hypothetical protein [Candidatus Thiodiazotropha sp. 'RUGA']
MTDNNVDQEEELFPDSIRKVGFWISLVFSSTIIIYYVAFIFQYVSPTPKDLGLPNLLLFSAVCFLFFAIPWRKLGLSLKKFGPIEFERKLEGQSEEHIKDISALEIKIAQLEAALKASVSEVKAVEIQPSPDENEIRDLIINFLTEYEQSSFSPLRMETWGAQRPGYSKLAGNSTLLRTLLRTLVSEGVLETRISKKGNTLYRINS